MLMALALAGHDRARTAPFILKPDIPLVSRDEEGQFEEKAPSPQTGKGSRAHRVSGGRKPASLDIQPVTAADLANLEP